MLGPFTSLSFAPRLQSSNCSLRQNPQADSARKQQELRCQEQQCKISACEYEQSTLSFAGAVEGKSDSGSVSSAKSRLSIFANNKLVRASTGLLGLSEATPWALNVDAATASLKAILEEIEKQFHKPEVIDERKKQDFVNVVVPSTPPLTE